MKMEIEILKLVIKGFRNITEAEIVLRNVTAIVGLNGYGKSNIITAIDFGIAFIQEPQKASMMAYKKGIPLLKKCAGMDYSFEIEAKVGDDIITYGYTFAWKTKHHSPKIKREYLRMKSASTTNRYSTYIQRDDDEAKYRSSEKGRCTKLIPIDEDELVLNKLTNYDTLFYHDILKKIVDLRFYVEKHLDTSSFYKPDIITHKQDENLFSSDNIPRTIWNMKEEYPQKYNILIDAFKQLFPFVDTIECTEHRLTLDSKIKLPDDADIMIQENIYTLMIQDRRLTQPINFEWLSDGTKRVFLSLTYAVLSDIEGLSALVVEEPENSIHPNLLQAYLRTLNDLSGECKIIFTSHSPYIIQYLPPENTYIGLNHESGQVDFRNIEKSEALNKSAARNGQSIGDFLFNCISFNNANEILADYLGKSTFEQNTDAEDDDDDWLNS